MIKLNNMSKSSFSNDKSSLQDQSVANSSITSNGSDPFRSSFQKSSIGSDGSNDGSFSGLNRKSKRNKRNKDPGTPRSQASDNDFDDDDDFSSSSTKSTDSNKGLGFFGKVAKTAVRAFVDYGPPYNNKPFRPDLVDECAKPVPSTFKIHNLLNSRENPNLADPSDLYYRPIHWCARNGHFTALKMLVRAGAELNVTTELGNTPLDLCVMMKLPPDKRSTQLKIVKYFLEKDALVNTRDKGGFSPIDHAAYNQDLEIINLLLDYGANVLRRNHVFVAPRTHILKNVYDPECYKALNDRLVEEEEVIEAEREREAQQKREEAMDNKLEVLLVSLSKKKQRKEQREKDRQAKEDQSHTFEERRKKLQDDMEKNLKAKAEARVANGIWKKTSDDHWELQEKTHLNIDRVDLYTSSRAIATDLRDKSSMSRYNTLWNQLSNGGKLEMKWKRSDPYDFLSDSLDKLTAENSKVVAKGFDAKDKKIADIDFKDENDAELEGEDLDDLMAALAI